MDDQTEFHSIVDTNCTTTVISTISYESDNFVGCRPPNTTSAVGGAGCWHKVGTACLCACHISSYEAIAKLLIAEQLVKQRKKAKKILILLVLLIGAIVYELIWLYQVMKNG